MEVVALMIVFGVFITSYLRFRDPLYPPVLQAVLWLVMLIILALSAPQLVPVPAEVYVTVALSSLAFASGAYVATLRGSGALLSTSQVGSPRRWVADAILLVTLIGLPLFAADLFSVAFAGPFENPFVNLRLAQSGDSFADVAPLINPRAPLNYLFPLSVASVALQFFLIRQHGNRRFFYAACFVALSLAGLASGRTFAMIVVSLIAGLLMIARRIGAVRGLATLFALGLWLFVVLGAAYNKIGSSTEDFAASVRSYSVGGIAAFGLRIQDYGDFDFGSNTFRTPLAVLDAIGYDVEVPSLVKEYRFVPDPTNVYTVFRPYYDDLGLVGVVIALGLFGWLHAWAYRLAVLGSAFFMCIYALLLYPLGMQFFQDQYFSLLSSWIQILIPLIIGFAGVGRVRTT